MVDTDPTETPPVSPLPSHTNQTPMLTTDTDTTATPPTPALTTPSTTPFRPRIWIQTHERCQQIHEIPTQVQPGKILLRKQVRLQQRHVQGCLQILRNPLLLCLPGRMHETLLQHGSMVNALNRRSELSLGLLKRSSSEPSKISV